jgi:Uma2 family endonuclease
MATASATKTEVGSGELRFVVHGVDWEGYEALLKIMPRVRMTYDRGSVEFMSPLFIHEHYSALLRKLVEYLAEELDIDYLPAGSTTYRKKNMERGLEPDGCFYFASARRIRSIRSFDSEIDPPPDLAIEVDITSSSLDRMEIYATLGVPEVWRFDGETFSIALLQEDSVYADSERSAAFPYVPIGDVPALLLDPDGNSMRRWAGKVRAWIRDEVVPRAGGAK